MSAHLDCRESAVGVSVLVVDVADHVVVVGVVQPLLPLLVRLPVLGLGQRPPAA